MVNSVCCYNVCKHGVHNSLCGTMVLEHFQSEVQDSVYVTMVVEPWDSDACISGFWEVGSFWSKLGAQTWEVGPNWSKLGAGLGLPSNLVGFPSNLVQL